ncbi:uncharacterized [Tachysurus ichikawai]
MPSPLETQSLKGEVASAKRQGYMGHCGIVGPCRPFIHLIRGQMRPLGAQEKSSCLRPQGCTNSTAGQQLCIFKQPLKGHIRSGESRRRALASSHNPSDPWSRGFGECPPPKVGTRDESKAELIYREGLRLYLLSSLQSFQEGVEPLKLTVMFS